MTTRFATQSIIRLFWIKQEHATEIPFTLIFCDKEKLYIDCWRYTPYTNFKIYNTRLPQRA